MFYIASHKPLKMSIKGGIVSNSNSVEMTISVKGGKPYKRIYNDVVSLAIDKFILIGSFLSKLISSKSPTDTKFYIEQTKQLLRRGHVELINGELPFHNKYNMWLLDGYLRMLLETCDLKLISQLLDLDSILYSIEQSDEVHSEIDFEIPASVKIQTLKSVDPKAEIKSPISDDIGAYLHSFNDNLNLLIKFVLANKHALDATYKCIIQQAKKRLQ